jgi:hypothetical protein
MPVKAESIAADAPGNVLWEASCRQRWSDILPSRPEALPILPAPKIASQAFVS